MEENTALVAQTETANQIFSQSEENQPFATFDMSTEEGQKLALSCVTIADIKLTDYIDQPITIAHVYAENAEFSQDDNTTRKGVRCVIIDTNGTTYATASKSIANALARFIKIRQGNISGLKVKVVTTSTRKGYKAYTLVPC